MHEVSVFRIDLAARQADAFDLLPVLDAKEAQRSRAFRYGDQGRRFIVAHAARRQILSQYVNEAPEALVFAEATYGKPYLAEHPDVSLNFSHVGSDGFLAVSRTHPVGIDLEQDDGRFEYRAIERGVCSPSEQEGLLSLQVDEAERRRLFFHLWTRKEALLKASGHGLYQTPDRVSVWGGGAFLEKTVTADQREASIVEIDGVSESYAGALAVIGAEPTVTHKEWQWL